MIRVNLLPHRQIRREARQREFGLMALFSAVAAIALVFLFYTYISGKVESQLERNQRLETAIANLDKEIAEIKDLKNQINAMLERKQVVENLQTNRSEAVVLFDELSRQLPEGMYFKSIKQQGSVITLEGVADTNARVATLVRNLASSQWMESPSLIEIKAVTVNAQKQNLFTMKVSLKKNHPDSDSASVSATSKNVGQP
ncbi:MAG: fimbrial protein [Betaproteobacteria bacterium HGW-Betaproteobacteria-22]|nr:MAG: fimbrial protein [Betaproteobacteria bacterium HGW-Betaproteobacteria-22]